MSAFLTGAFGNVGTSALHELLRQEHKVLCFDVKTEVNKKTAERFQGKVDVLWGDLRNKEDAEKAVQQQDVVVHLAAIIPPLSEAKPEWAREINVGGTQNLVSAMKVLPKPPKFLFTSS